MKISVDNYQQVFEDLRQRLSGLEGGSNKNVNDIIKNVKEKASEVQQGGDVLRQENGILKIGVVGQVKAGKSSFLNSLMFDGENVLPRASTPMTAGLTVLKYGEENQFEVEYYNTSEWHFFEDKSKEFDDIIQSYKQDNPSLTDEDIVRMAHIDSSVVSAKEMVSSCSRVARSNIQDVSKVDVRKFTDAADLQDILEEYVGARGKFTSIVKCLTIKLNDERLRDIQIVDTPGVNDPVLSREQRTREFLRECHGVFFLSYSGRFFDSTDVSFLTDRIGSQGIGTIVLIASKFDSVLQDVGKKYNDDLGNAIDYCQHALKKQYQTNIATSGYNGNDPIVDFSSGIGFSIAHKEESRWDEIEAHVVKQMRNFYPNFFSTPEETKETFLNLSQMEDIREKYVEGTFKRNKDRIINEKVNAYFANSNEELQKIVAKGKKRLEEDSEYLQKSDIGQNEDRKKRLENVLAHIKGDMESIRNNIDNVVEQSVKECLNGFDIRWDGKIPTIPGTFICCSGFLGMKDIQCQYDKVDMNELVKTVSDLVDKALNNVANVWKEKNQKIQGHVKEAIGMVITQSEEDDEQGQLDGRILRNILDETLSGMSNKATINIANIRNRVKGDLTAQLQGLDSVKDKYGDGEVVAKQSIQKAVSDSMSNIRARLNVVLSSIFPETEEALKTAAENSVDVLKANKDKFLLSINKNTEDYLNNLEQQLEDKKNQLEIMTAVIDELNKIEMNYE